MQEAKARGTPGSLSPSAGTDPDHDVQHDDKTVAGAQASWPRGEPPADTTGASAPRSGGGAAAAQLRHAQDKTKTCAS